MATEKGKKQWKVLTPSFRVSFPCVFKPRSAFDNQEPKYSIVMLFPKEVTKSEEFKALKKLCQDAAKEKWGDQIPKNIRLPWRDGDEEKSHLAGYPGSVFMTASTRMKPGLVDEKLQDIINESDFYAGCWARATINAFAYDTMGNKGIGIGLINIQKIKDDDPFVNRSKPEDDFTPVETADVDNSEMFDDEKEAEDEGLFD